MIAARSALRGLDHSIASQVPCRPGKLAGCWFWPRKVGDAIALALMIAISWLCDGTKEETIESNKIEQDLEEVAFQSMDGGLCDLEGSSG